MINNDFISAAEGFENFLAKKRRHGKRGKSQAMLEYCQSQIPYQQVNYGVEAFIKSEFTDALEWFNAAEKEAKDDLKIKIQQHRRNIAAELLDSVKNYKNIKIKGFNSAEKKELVEDARYLCNAGVFSIVIEAVAESAAKAAVKKIKNYNSSHCSNFIFVFLTNVNENFV